MGIGATTLQKATFVQIGGNRRAHQGARRPLRLLLVVVPGFTAVKTQGRCRGDQAPMRQAIAGGVGEQGQATGGMDRRHHSFGPQGRAHGRHPLQIGRQGLEVLAAAQGEHMHQTTIQQGTDFKPAPELRHALTARGQLGEGKQQRPMGRHAVVIGDGDVLQTERHGLGGQLGQGPSCLSAVVPTPVAALQGIR